jgi:hypothetical protein
MGTQVTMSFWIAVGSALGGVLRYWCSGLVARWVGETFPWGTIVVYVVGSRLIGLFATLSGPDGRLFVGTTARQFVIWACSAASPPSRRWRGPARIEQLVGKLERFKRCEKPGQ